MCDDDDECDENEEADDIEIEDIANSLSCNTGNVYVYFSLANRVSDFVLLGNLIKIRFAAKFKAILLFSDIDSVLSFTYTSSTHTLTVSLCL